MFSAWEVFTRVLNKPTDYDFTDEDVSEAGGEIWADYLHPTSKMHDILASDISTFLQGVHAL